MNYTKNAIAVLKAQGYRITSQRKLIVEILDQSARPLSAYEIRDLLAAKGEAVDLASVYRTIECFEKHHLIHRMLSTGKIRKCFLESEEHCHREEANHCHHCIVCRTCGAVHEFHCHGLEAIVADLGGSSGFAIEAHYLELSGLCPRCKESSGTG